MREENSGGSLVVNRSSASPSSSAIPEASPRSTTAVGDSSVVSAEAGEHQDRPPRSGRGRSSYRGGRGGRGGRSSHRGGGGGEGERPPPPRPFTHHPRGRGGRSSSRGGRPHSDDSTDHSDHPNNQNHAPSLVEQSDNNNNHHASDHHQPEPSHATRNNHPHHSHQADRRRHHPRQHQQYQQEKSRVPDGSFRNNEDLSPPAVQDRQETALPTRGGASRDIPAVDNASVARGASRGGGRGRGRGHHYHNQQEQHHHHQNASADMPNSSRGGRGRGRSRGGRGRGRGTRAGRGGRYGSRGGRFAEAHDAASSTEPWVEERETMAEPEEKIEGEQHHEEFEDDYQDLDHPFEPSQREEDEEEIVFEVEGPGESEPTPIENEGITYPLHNMTDGISTVPLETFPEREAASDFKKVLALPTPPPLVKGGRDGVPMILSRQHHPPAQRQAFDYEIEAQVLSERLAEAALEDDHEEADVVVKEVPAPPKKPKKMRKKRGEPKASARQEGNDAAAAAEGDAPLENISTTAAIKALPAQEVNISASTQVKIRRNDSSPSLNKSEPTVSKAATEPKSSNGKSKRRKGLSGDAYANEEAARRFNNQVRQCVERSDPDLMREILRDKYNHNFALDHSVLETVMKAYVMAAMFEDALYCLRNCTLPGTLSTLQTERILTCLPQNLRNSSAYTAADMINALCIATDFDSRTSRTYFLRIVRGIALEFLEEATSARDRICSAPCERLVRASLCVVNARFKRGKKPSELEVQPGDQLGVFVPDTIENRGIQAGDAVSILPYAGPYPMSAESLDRNMIEATVINTNPMVVRLQDRANAELYATLTEPTEGNVYRIDKLANRMGFNRQLAAAVAIASPIGENRTRDLRRPCPQLIRAITAMDENIDRVMKQTGNLPRGELTSTAALCAEAVPWNADDESDDLDQDTIRGEYRLALEKYGALENLNDSQQLAVEGATTNRLTLVQGPPGTGKTAVAIRILQHWARLAAAAVERGENPAPILATSDSNIAVDNLVEGCAAVGLRVVRLGRPEAIRPELLRYCIDRPSQTNQNGQPSNNSGGSAFKERTKQQLKSAQVVCCTCIGSGGDLLDALGPLERVLVDEATQATEPAVLVPLMRGCRQLVLVGDHCQLPPTVLSTRAEEEGLGVPLFSRMVACGVPPYMLDTQYRMHPCIAMFPSDLFYGGLLRNGVSAPERRPLAGFPWPREEFPVAFMPTKGVEMDDGVSKYNEAEAAAACDVVAMLLQGGQCAVSDIAVVTPYAAQARLIRRMTRRLTQNTGPPFIEVSSVDGFQGREKEAVVFSAVRSNDYGAIGFTSDWRRVNVSFTRARRALIVIGNDQTLRRGDPDTWMPWLAWVDAHGLNMDKPGVPRGRYEPEQLRRVRGGTTAAEMLKDVLERQQAQLKTAEQQQERATKNTIGHIIGTTVNRSGVVNTNQTNDDSNAKPLSLEEDLALMANSDGNWDDSDEDDKPQLRHSISKATMSSAASSVDLPSGEESGAAAVDVWDL